MEVYQRLKDPNTGRVMYIMYDEYADNPRKEFDCNIGKFAVKKHCRYVDDEANRELDFCSRKDDEKALDRDKNIAAYLPVYVYDHSGARMNTTGFSCPWDSGQIGWIIAFKDTVKSLFPSWKIITKKRRETILEWLRGEVETYSAYISGETYGFKVFEANPDGTDDDNEIDSCWGYYGGDGIQAIREEYPEFTEELA